MQISKKSVYLQPLCIDLGIVLKLYSLLDALKTDSTHVCASLTPPRRLSSYDDGEENAAHPHMMICRLRRNVFNTPGRSLPSEL